MTRTSIEGITWEEAERLLSESMKEEGAWFADPSATSGRALPILGNYKNPQTAKILSSRPSMKGNQVKQRSKANLMRFRKKILIILVLSLAMLMIAVPLIPIPTTCTGNTLCLAGHYESITRFYFGFGGQSYNGIDTYDFSW